MNEINKTILTQVTSAVCKYLNIDENLFFCGMRESRIQSARNYVSYLSMVQGVEAIHIAKWLGLTQSRMVYVGFNYIKGHTHEFENTQVTRDIEKLSKILQVANPA